MFTNALKYERFECLNGRKLELYLLIVDLRESISVVLSQVLCVSFKICFLTVICTIYITCLGVVSIIQHTVYTLFLSSSLFSNKFNNVYFYQ